MHYIFKNSIRLYTHQKFKTDTQKWPYLKFKRGHLFQTTILCIHVSFGGCVTSCSSQVFFQQKPEVWILVCCKASTHGSSSSFPNHHDMFVGFPLVKNKQHQKKETCEGLHVCSQSEKNPTLWRGQDEGKQVEPGSWLVCLWWLVSTCNLDKFTFRKSSN